MWRVTRLRIFRHTPRVFLLAPCHLNLSTTIILAESFARHEKCFRGTKTESTSTVGAFPRLETEKRGCELSINAFQHFFVLQHLALPWFLTYTYASGDILKHEQAPSRCISHLIILRTGTIQRTPKTSDWLTFFRDRLRKRTEFQYSPFFPSSGNTWHCPDCIVWRCYVSYIETGARDITLSYIIRMVWNKILCIFSYPKPGCRRMPNLSTTIILAEPLARHWVLSRYQNRAHLGCWCISETWDWEKRVRTENQPFSAFNLSCSNTWHCLDS